MASHSDTDNATCHTQRFDTWHFLFFFQKKFKKFKKNQKVQKKI